MTAPTPRSAHERSLPKAHLHVHLEGAARTATIGELAKRHDRPAPDLTGFADPRGFAECYRRVTDLIRTPDDLARVITEFVADEAAQGVLYSEPMIGPWLYADRFGWSVADTFAFIDDTFQQAARNERVELRYLLGVNWARPLEWIEQAAAFAVEHAEHNIAGIGFAGIEPCDRFDRYSRPTALVRAHGLLVVPHIGETQGPQSIRAALTAIRPHRIAHGVRAADDPRLLDQFAEHGIVCDVCPTSNVRLGVTSSLRDHPLPTFLRHGVPTTLNADDPLLFATTLTGEYTQVKRVLAVSTRHLADLAAADTQATGMTETTRTRLRSGIQRWLTCAQPMERNQHG